MIDLVLLVLNALAQFAAAWLGFHVAAKPPPKSNKNKRRLLEGAFVLLSCIGIGTIVGIGYRSASVQEATRTALDDIRHRLSASKTGDGGGDIAKLYAQCLREISPPSKMATDVRIAFIIYRRNGFNGGGFLAVGSGADPWPRQT